MKGAEVFRNQGLDIPEGAARETRTDIGRDSLPGKQRKAGGRMSDSKKQINIRLWAASLMSGRFAQLGRVLYGNGLIELVLGAGLVAGGAACGDQGILSSGTAFLTLGTLRVAVKRRGKSENLDLPDGIQKQPEDGVV